MNSLYNHYIIDMSTDNNFVQNPTMQGDGNGIRGIEIELIANGLPYEIDATNTIISIMGSKPDTKHIMNECTLSDEGYILVDITSQMSAVKGRGDYCIVLMDKNTNSQIKSFPFHILTTSAPFNISEIISSDEFQLLTKRITHVEGIVIEGNEIIEDLTKFETTAKASESARVKAENERKSAETQRVNAENTRITSENKRIDDENKRISDENDRKSAETTRNTDEQKRIDNEKTRIANENKRIADENDRNDAEIIRENNEQDRKTAFDALMENANSEVERLQKENDTASASAILAEQYADSANKDANIATTKASVASTSASNALVSEQNSKISEQNAKESEINSKESELSSANSAQSALNDASIATSQATIATNAANSVLDIEDKITAKVDEAFNYSELSKSYAVGTNDIIRPNDSTDNAKFYYEQIKLIASEIPGGLIPKGTITFEELESQEKEVGYMYNISNSFITTNTFKVGEGQEYPKGTNVYYTSDGYWNCLIGGGYGSGNTNEINSETQPLDQDTGDYWLFQY